MGVTPMAVSHAIKRGRISRTPKGVDWKLQAPLWEDNRVDSLAGTGTSNKKGGKQKTVTIKGENPPPIPAIPKMKPFEELDTDSDDDTEEEESASLPKKGTLAYEAYLEKKAKREWAEIRVMKERGELLPRHLVISVYGAVMNGLKTGILALPMRSTIQMTAIIKKWMVSHKIEVDEGAFVFLEKELEQAFIHESRFVLENIQEGLNNIEREADHITELRIR